MAKDIRAVSMGALLSPEGLGCGDGGAAHLPLLPPPHENAVDAPHTQI
jgi:hypothetical protein